jgi:purine-nucleoside phosphorylase
MDTKVFDRAAAALPHACFERPPDVGLILGSGWSQALETAQERTRVPYADIPGLGAGEVAGHAGELVLFERHGVRVAAFMGRRHWYEGVGWEAVLLPVELLRRMGAARLLVTNAAGGINSHLQPGSLMIIRDHINITGINPLAGPVVPGWGPRFPDQSRLYSPALSSLLHRAAGAAHVALSEGVYIYSPGPGFETPAEIRAYAGLGADAVGMSTVHEVTLANAAGLEVAGLSCITNMAAGISGPHLSHDEVIEQTGKSAPTMARLLVGFMQQCGLYCNRLQSTAIDGNRNYTL